MSREGLTLRERADTLWPQSPDMVLKTRREETMLDIMCELISSTAFSDQFEVLRLREQVTRLQSHNTELVEEVRKVRHKYESVCE